MKTIATIGGLGYSPIGPGTLGSAVGLAVAWILSGSPVQQAAGCAVAIGLGFWSAGPTAKALGKSDPVCIVIDEVAGMMVALAFLPVTWPVYAAAFFLFRLLDIKKPGPIRAVERLPGSLGIMADDLVAGLAVNLMVRLALIGSLLFTSAPAYALKVEAPPESSGLEELREALLPSAGMEENAVTQQEVKAVLDQIRIFLRDFENRRVTGRKRLKILRLQNIQGFLNRDLRFIGEKPDSNPERYEEIQASAPGWMKEARGIMAQFRPSPPLSADSRSTQVIPRPFPRRMKSWDFQAHQNRPVEGLVFDPTQEGLLFSASMDSTVRSWSVQKRRLVQRWRSSPPDQKGIHLLTVSPDGKFLAYGSFYSRSVVILDAGTGEEVQSLLSAEGSRAISSLAFNPLGNLLGVGMQDGRILFWKRDPSGHPFASSKTFPEAHRGWVTALAFTPDGKTLISGGLDDAIRFWEIGSEEPFKELSPGTKGVTRLALSPDGKVLASGGEDGTLHVWEVATGISRFTLKALGGPVRGLSFGPDGRILASGGDSSHGSVQLWDVETGKRLGILRGKISESEDKAKVWGVRGLAFSPSGRLLVAANFNSTLRFWELPSPAAGLEEDQDPFPLPQKPGSRETVRSYLRWAIDGSWEDLRGSGDGAMGVRIELIGLPDAVSVSHLFRSGAVPGHPSLLEDTLGRLGILEKLARGRIEPEQAGYQTGPGGKIRYVTLRVSNSGLEEAGADRYLLAQP